MKRSVVAIILFALLLPLCFCISAGAEDTDYYTLNDAQIKEKFDLLDALMNGYSNTTINSEITPYASAITILRGDSRMNTEDLSGEIEMYYVKGRIAGRCAWVYVTYSPALGEEELAEVSVKYRDTLNSIKGNADISDLESKEETYSLNLMKEIYLGRIEMLYTAEDSRDISLLAYSYELKIKEIPAFDEAEFERIYTEAETAIAIQRIRERAEASYSSLYNTVYGDGAYAENGSTDKKVISFLHDIGLADTLTEFNASLKSGANGILAELFDGLDGEYAKALHARLSGAVAEKIGAADAAGEIAEDWSDFAGIDLAIEKAEARDGLVGYASVSSASDIAGVSDIIAEYNSDGAIFDLCLTSDDVTLELGKAKLRIDLAVYLIRAEDEVQGIYGEDDASGMLARIDALRAPYDSAIKSKATLNTAQDALAEAKGEADKVVSDARALLEEYRGHAQRIVGSEYESNAYKMKHNIKYLKNADVLTDKMYEKACLRKEEIGAANTISDIDRIMAEALGEQAALYAEAEQANLAAAIEANTKKIRDKESGVLSQIEKLGYLDDPSAYTSPLSDRADDVAGVVASMADIAQIESKAAEFLEYADGVLKAAVAENAENEKIYLAREAAKKSFEESRDEAFVKLGELKYLSESEAAEARVAIEGIYFEYLEKIATAEELDGISAALKSGKEAMDGVVVEASLKNLENARSAIGEELDEKFAEYIREDYSEENYKKISDAYGKAAAAIDNGKTVSEFLEARDKAFEAMGAVPSEFELAKSAAIAELTAAYDALAEHEERYSEAEFGKLTEIYRHTLAELECFDKADGAEVLSAAVRERIKLMKDIKVAWVSSGEIGASSGSTADYPAGHDTEKDKLWGVIIGSDGIYSDITVSITEKDIQKAHKTALNEALEGSRFSYIGDDPMTDADIAAIISDSEIWAIYDVKLIRDGAVWSEFSGKYTVRILLPKGMRDIDGLRAVYLSDDGGAEFYDARREGSFLVFETSHFSEFIIVGEKKIDLLPIIIILASLSIVEAAVAVALTYVLKRGKGDRLAAVAAPLPTLAVIAPKGAVAWIVMLAAADIALGAYITVCAVRLISQRATEESIAEVPEAEVSDFGEEITPEEEKPTATVEIMGAVSAEEADTLVSDSSAAELLVKEEAPEIYKGRKAFVNVDTISEYFEAGETVTLGELKKKKLVASNVCYLKVLARGVIDKPLTVKAQSFSTNAIKMIALTGGSAVIESNAEYIGD